MYHVTHQGDVVSPTLPHDQAMAFAIFANRMAALEGVNALYRCVSVSQEPMEAVDTVVELPEPRPLFEIVNEIASHLTHLKEWFDKGKGQFDMETEINAIRSSVGPEVEMKYMKRGEDGISFDEWVAVIKAKEGQYRVNIPGIFYMQRELKKIEKGPHKHMGQKKIYPERRSFGGVKQQESLYHHNLQQAQRNLPKLSQKIKKDWKVVND